MMIIFNEILLIGFLPQVGWYFLMYGIIMIVYLVLSSFRDSM